jgi:N-methylhydantoinase A/oxoprolinase/acetone carboxylase beta subunit
MRGAAFLSGVADAIVVDIGGTTSDVGSLHKGFPRQATVAVEVGGVRTNFRMPDVFSIGLGGGSHVVESGGAIKVGPTSVGYRIVTEALIFGGSNADDLRRGRRLGALRAGRQIQGRAPDARVHREHPGPGSCRCSRTASNARGCRPNRCR